MKKFTRIKALVLACAMCMSLLAACGSSSSSDSSSDSSSSSSSASTDAASDNGVVVALHGEPTTLNPYDHNSQVSSIMSYMVYSCLVGMDEDLNFIPDLASSWETSDDGTLWTFHLRDDVTFHNGDAMTSADVVASLAYAQTYPECESSHLSFCEIEAVDDYTVTISTEEPCAYLLALVSKYSNAIVPVSLIEAGNDFNDNPVGCGPWKFVSWDASEKLMFEAFDDFYECDLLIDYVEFKVIPEGSSRTIALQSGDADMIMQFSSSDYEILEEDENIEVYLTDSVTSTWIAINNSVAPFDDENFRKAVSAAIPREDIVVACINGLGTVNATQEPLGLNGATTENSVEYDMTVAQEYLDAWGRDPSEGDFSILCSSENKIKYSEVIQASLATLGITVTIETCDAATYMALCDAGEYQAAGCGFSDSILYTYLGFTSTTENYTHMIYEDVLDAWTYAGTLADTDAHNAAMEEVSSLLNDHCPLLYLYDEYHLSATNKDLAGVEINPQAQWNWRTLYWET